MYYGYSQRKHDDELKLSLSKSYLETCSGIVISKALLLILKNHKF